MRVVCVKLINPITGGQVDSSPWLEVGAEYVVISISASSDGEVFLRLVDSDPLVPGLHKLEMFSTVSSAIPKSWATRADNGTLEIGPQRWLDEPGFWERFFDGEASIVKIYREELQKILDQEPSGLDG